MKLASVTIGDIDTAAVVVPGGCLPLQDINRALQQSWPVDIFDLIGSGALDELQRWYRQGGREAVSGLSRLVVPADSARSAPPYRRPRKIWGIGLNYAAHAADLSESTPTGMPGSFMKPDTTVIGPGDAICIPALSEKTTAEAELGVIIGRQCRNVQPENWREVVAGFTAIIDMTAEDILRRNPRYLTVSKSFDTFFSFGPQLVTPDEVEDVSGLSVATVINGHVHAANSVANMTFSPAVLVSFLSRVMTLLPGDIISTGTPGAVTIQHGDVVESRIDGFEPLVNPVVDLKTGDGNRPR